MISTVSKVLEQSSQILKQISEEDISADPVLSTTKFTRTVQPKKVEVPVTRQLSQTQQNRNKLDDLRNRGRMLAEDIDRLSVTFSKFSND